MFRRGYSESASSLARFDDLDEFDDLGGGDAAVVVPVDEVLVVDVAARPVVLHGSHGDGRHLPVASQLVPVGAPPYAPPAGEHHATVRRHAVAATLEVVEVFEVG